MVPVENLTEWEHEGLWPYEAVEQQARRTIRREPMGQTAVYEADSPNMTYANHSTRSCTTGLNCMLLITNNTPLILRAQTCP